MSNNISKIGCVTASLAKDAGFISYSDLFSIGSLEECLAKADENGKLCADNDIEHTDEKCHFVAYKDGSHDDLLREAVAEYQKKEYGDKKYIENSLLLFKDIWLSYSFLEREDQLSGNLPFLSNFAPWIKESKGKKPDYMKWFYDNLKTDIKPISAKNQKNKCWIGGKNVLKYQDYTHFIDNMDNMDNLTNKLSKCKDKDYALYIVPGTEGSNYIERLTKMYNQQASEDKKKADKASKKAISSFALAKLVSNPEQQKSTLVNFANNVITLKENIDNEENTKDIKKEINEGVKKILDNDIYIEKIKDLTNISTNAINSNIDFVKDKQNVANKMEADLQTLTWSLTESENKELLQNKITTTLGIIIMLFSALCVGLIIYYLIGGIPGTSINIKNKSNKNVLNNIFGFGKVSTTSSDKKAFNSLFS